MSIHHAAKLPIRMRHEGSAVIFNLFEAKISAILHALDDMGESPVSQSLSLVASQSFSVSVARSLSFSLSLYRFPYSAKLLSPLLRLRPHKGADSRSGQTRAAVVLEICFCRSISRSFSASHAIEAVISPVPLTSAKSRMRFSNLFATRGVPRQRFAIS